jgi:hypothetical protein
VHAILLAVPEEQVHELRIGQKVAFTGIVIGADATTVYMSTTKMTPETHMLRCNNGHEYGPSSGYRFCPIDGLPLR